MAMWELCRLLHSHISHQQLIRAAYQNTIKIPEGSYKQAQLKMNTIDPKSKSGRPVPRADNLGRINVGHV